jgi:hypothetical protein
LEKGADMNERQKRALVFPIVQGRRIGERDFDEMVTVGEFSVITRVSCYTPHYGDIGHWQARATILTESGEALSTIWPSDEVKTQIYALLRDLL